MKSFEHYVIVLRRKFIRPILQNETLARFLSKHCLKIYLAWFYENWMGRRMNYCHPRDLNQALMKLSWKNSRDPKMRKLVSTCADKYAVREYVASKGHPEILNELYGVYDNVEDINFETLPKQFVMKMNNASGRNYICLDKSKCDWEAVKSQFSKWLKDPDYAWETGEWQYAIIKPRIVIEKYLEDLGTGSLIDYKAQVFHGKVVDFFVCYNRVNDMKKADEPRPVCYDCYTTDWKRTEDIVPQWHLQRQLIPQPKTLSQMIKVAEDCASDFEYCRFDMYEIDGKIILGEMTLTPHGNVLDFYTQEYLDRMKDVL